jgi:hypothetical protein
MLWNKQVQLQCLSYFQGNEISSKITWTPYVEGGRKREISVKYGCANLLQESILRPKLRVFPYSCVFNKYMRPVMSRGSSVSIASDFGLDDRAIEIQSPAGTKRFCLCLSPDRHWGPSSLLSNGYRGSFPGTKARQGRDADHSPLSSAEVMNG